MRLVSPDGQSLELEILGYQFPELKTEEYDSNWLVILGKVGHPDGGWRFIEPCLLTYEVDELAAWLEEHSKGVPSHPEIDFIEPNISFQSARSNETAQLRVYFELEARPHRAPAKSAGQRDLYVEFPIGKHSLIRAAESLRDQLRKYPQRARR